MRAVLASAMLVCLWALPANASTYHPVTKTCPIGGETFVYPELGSISTWGELPDGMPLGSGRFPVALPQCPGNGLVLYKAFSADEIARLKAVVAAPEYRELRARETPYYLAYRLATALSDTAALWLLLSATWEAKEDEADTARVRRYNEAFVAAVAALPTGFDAQEMLALRARAANALRELGRFDEAERLRAAIRIDPVAFSGEDAAEQRPGGAGFVRKLAAPIARRDAGRTPIDMLDERSAVYRCLEPEYATKYGQPAPAPLTAFERGWCARPELAKAVREARAAFAR